MDLFAMIVLCPIFWLILVWFVREILLKEKHSCNQLLRRSERTIMLLLAPLTVVICLLCWALSGGDDMNDWLYLTLKSRAYRKSMRTQKYSASILHDHER